MITLPAALSESSPILTSDGPLGKVGSVADTAVHLEVDREVAELLPDPG